MWEWNLWGWSVKAYHLTFAHISMTTFSRLWKINGALEMDIFLSSFVRPMDPAAKRLHFAHAIHTRSLKEQPIDISFCNDEKVLEEKLESLEEEKHKLFLTLKKVLARENTA